MAYEVIARKWRPQTFESVVGQEHVVRTMRNAIESGRIAQAYLLCGPRGTGKTTLARIFAKSLNCKYGPTVTPCCKCDNCTEIERGSSLDVVEIDGASNNSVDDVHEKILNSVNFMPASGKFRIFYIDEVHMLSAAAFNALLKTLEEPPPHVKFIFATTEPDKVIGTIVSRCQRFDLRRLTISEIAGQLRKISESEGIEISDDAVFALARMADGGMRDAESALDQIISFTGSKIAEEDVLGVFGLVSRDTIEKLAESILRGDIVSILGYIRDLDNSGKDLRRLAIELIEHFRNVLVCIHLGGESPSFIDIAQNRRETIKNQAAIAGAAAVLSVMEQLIELENRLRLSLSPRTLTETVLIRCAKSASGLVDLEEILKRLNELSTSISCESAESSGTAPVPRPEEAAVTLPTEPNTIKEQTGDFQDNGIEDDDGSADAPDSDYVNDYESEDENADPDCKTSGIAVPETVPPVRFRPNSEIIHEPSVEKAVKMLNGKIIDITHPR